MISEEKICSGLFPLTQPEAAGPEKGWVSVLPDESPLLGFCPPHEPNQDFKSTRHGTQDAHVCQEGGGPGSPPFPSCVQKNVSSSTGDVLTSGNVQIKRNNNMWVA